MRGEEDQDISSIDKIRSLLAKRRQQREIIHGHMGTGKETDANAYQYLRAGIEIETMEYILRILEE